MKKATVIGLADEDLTGSADADVLDRAVKYGRVVVTHDLAFGLQGAPLFTFWFATSLQRDALRGALSVSGGLARVAR